LLRVRLLGRLLRRGLLSWLLLRRGLGELRLLGRRGLLRGRLRGLLLRMRLLLSGLLRLSRLLRRTRFLLRRGGPGELSGRGNERRLGLSRRLTGLFRDRLPLRLDRISRQLRLSRLVGRRHRELRGSRLRLRVGRRGFRSGNLRLIDLRIRRFCRSLRLRPGLLGR
jgi:hypothetical protein